jgi:hypothetical protein
MLTGGCLCGATRYEAQGTPFHETNCHCTMCRRATGAPVVTWFSVARSALRFTGQAPAAYRSSSHATRRFCATCGTQLTFETDRHPDEIDVTTCSLDEPAALPPHDQVMTETRLPWVSLETGLPAYPGGRTARGS